MKLAICSQGEGLEADVDLRFGRCSYFVIVDTLTKEVIGSLANSGQDMSGGAGPQAAQLLSNSDVEAIALGNVGPKAATALEASRIKVYTGVEGTVGQTLQKFLDGKLPSLPGKI